MEAEGRAPRRRQRGVVAPRLVQQGEGADDVGLDERGRAVDRAIDVGLRREVHHRVGLVGREDLAHRGGIGDVGADQHVARMAACLLQRLLRGGIGQLVDVDHHVVGVAHQVAHHGGSDEAASAGQQEFHLPGLCRFTRANGKRVLQPGNRMCIAVDKVAASARARRHGLPVRDCHAAAAIGRIGASG